MRTNQKIKFKIDSYLRSFFRYKNEELPSYLLQKLFNQGTSYLPYTSSSLKFRLLVCISNDVVINCRKNILELGSGISTVILARLIKMNKLNSKVVSVDDNLDWINIIKKIIIDEGLESYVEFIHCPKVKSLDIDYSFEYDGEVLNKNFLNMKFDMVIIDGPLAWNEEIYMSRVSNVKHFINNLEDSFTIFVDDTERKGEKILVETLKNKLNIKPQYMDPTFTVFSKGQNFNFGV